MKKTVIHTSCKRMLADVFTPVGIYLRLRDRFRDTILLESTDHHAAENSWSFICVNAVGGIQINRVGNAEYKMPVQKPVLIPTTSSPDPVQLVRDYMDMFEIEPPSSKEAVFAQGLFGYTSYDAVQFFENIKLKQPAADAPDIPLIRYRLYQYVIAFNHFKDEIFLCENMIAGLESSALLESLIRGRDLPVYPFKREGDEVSNMSDNDYKNMVEMGIHHCYRGDVFQVVLSRRFQQSFKGDEFNVYRALRSVNPSPYLFFFDYGDYKLIGSSPEAQLVIQNGKALLHPIAGTFRRTGEEESDQREAERLVKDAKENAEHVMLVDLARNDLSRSCDEVRVEHFKEVQYYSHVIHLVSEVKGNVKGENNGPYELLAKTFPAGTLSGAPKYRAMELIDKYEPTSRGYYGGAIGSIGFNGSCNHAIMIRTFLSSSNKLYYQAGAGIVAASNPPAELAEVNNKLEALKKAIILAEEVG